MILSDGRLGRYRIKALVFETEKYDLYKTISNNALLVVRDSLYHSWVNDQLFFAIDPFKKVQIQDEKYYYLLSDKNYAVTPVCFGNSLCGRKQATAFAFALKQMRSVTDKSLYDGIYLEEFGYILPTYTNVSASDDATIGCFLSGGQTVHFSDSSFHSLLLDNEAYDDISRIVGIVRHTDASFEGETLEESKSEESAEFSLPGRPDLERFFKEHIIDIINNSDRYKRLGIDFPSSVVLYGPPGCGKTYAVDKLVSYLGFPKFEINSATIASSYTHETAKKIAGVFESAIKSAPSVVVIDEMESFLSNRELQSSNSQRYEEVAEFLRQIQKAQKSRVIIIAMTNMYNMIDPAVLRRGRFDYHIEVGLPSVEEITSLLISITKDIALADDVFLPDVAKMLTGKSLADVSFVVKEAGLISGRNGANEISLDAILEAISFLPTEQPKRRIGFATE